MRRFTTHLLLPSLLLAGMLGSSARPLHAQATFMPRVAAGYSHGISLAPNGAVATHGENRAGEIGNGTTSGRLSPFYIAPPTGKAWAQVAAGDFRSTALTTTGEMYSWGSNGYGQLTPNNISQYVVPTFIAAPAGTSWAGVAAGYGHTLALGADGSLYTWGTNHYGQLGTGTAVALSRLRITAASGKPWTQVAAGYNFSLALCADGLLYAWGSNSDGQLGDGTTTSRATPVGIAPPSGVAWVQVAGGFWSTAAVCSDGSIYTWGSNYKGQLGNGTTSGQLTPARVAPPTGLRWVQVAVGYGHMLAVCSDGSLYAWGNNYEGQLGDGTTTSRRRPVRIAPPAGKQWVQVAAGFDHSMALASDGQVYTTGYNYSGELGDGTTRNSNCFVRTCGALAATAPAALQPLAVPNPFQDELHLTLNTSGSVLLTLYNGLGQCVLRQQQTLAAPSTVRLNGLAALPAGVYVLHVATSQAQHVAKLTHY